MKETSVRERIGAKPIDGSLYELELELELELERERGDSVRKGRS